jgi:hypothetical protein
MTKYDNENERILKSFNIPEYIKSKEFVDQIKLSSHTQIAESCKQFGFKYNHDYLRSCGNLNFTDLYPNAIINDLNDNSKYIIIKENLIGVPPIALVSNTFKEDFLYIYEYYIKRGYYDKNKNCIKGHFIDENILRFGTQKHGYYNIEFEKANITTLIKQKSYLLSVEHLHLQAQLCAIGAHLGLGSKIARGEKNQSVWDVNINKIASVQLLDLQIKNMLVKKEREEIDLVDVVWSDRLDGKIIAAFEVELSENWKPALDRLQSLKLACNSYSHLIKFVIVADEKYYGTIKELAQMERYKRDFSINNLYFLPICNFLDILVLRDKNILDVFELSSNFFNDALLPIECNQLVN